MAKLEQTFMKVWKIVLDKNPKATNGSYVDLILSDEDDPKQWGAYIKSESESKEELTIGVTTPPDCAVGKWVLQINTVKLKDKEADVFLYCPKHPLLVYILFNPWCEDDTVYMEDKKLLGEYVLNDTGKIYRGNKKRISPCAWNFGQVNSFDNNGVLAGNWSGNYEGGTSPLSWTGSVAILEEYFKKKETVYYGQCWVFSGVVTTLCRALGIPARSVTNYASAHDQDGSISIDSIHTEGPTGEFEIDKGLSNDSVWNFHVWNEVWMARLDLPQGYGGWQAIDATPQEESGGYMCMGPASLHTVKHGEVNLPHDGKFLFAEVNADRVSWLLGRDGKMRVIGINKSSVGKFISTKRAFGRASFREYGISGDLDREDLTDCYKMQEGSMEERAAVRRANVFSTRKNIYQTGTKDVEFEICCDDDAYIGQPLKVELKMTNTSGTKRSVSGTITVSAMFYTGVIGGEKHEVCKEKKSCTLNGKEKKSIGIEIPMSDYGDKMLDHCMFKVAFVFLVDETKQAFTDTDNFRLRKHHPTIEAPDKGSVGKKVKGKVSFVNKLPVAMTNCKLTLEGPGLQIPVTLKQKDIAAGEKFEHCFEMTPVKPGDKDIIVNFDCKQVEGMDESHSMTITK